MEFCEIFLQRVEDDPSIIDQIIWFDEAIFSLAETVNRHNCVYWDKINPNITNEIDNIG
jgi:hypothetical protein